MCPMIPYKGRISAKILSFWFGGIWILGGAATNFSLGTPIEPENPHIVLILVDDMGYGDVGCFNPQSRIPTPNIDSLARDGMRFTDAHSAGALCHPSRYGLLTGQYPVRANPDQWRTRATIAEDQITLPAMLKSAGYHTAMVGKWHLGFNEKSYDEPMPGGPVDRGFDSFFGIRASTDIPPYFYIRDRRAVAVPTLAIESSKSPDWSPIQGAFWREGTIAPDLQLNQVLPDFAEEALKIIRDHPQTYPKNPLFLYFALPSPHTPWLPTEKFLGRSQVGLYGDFVMMVDDVVGQALNALEGSGLARKTLVLFSSDNGPVWYPGDVERFHHDSAGGWRGMKSDAWEAGHRIPWIMRWINRIPHGSTCPRTIGFVDLLSTLADLVGCRLTEAETRDSVSFFPCFTDPSGGVMAQRPPLLIRSGGGLNTVRHGPWKVIQGLGSGGFSQPAHIKPMPNQPNCQLYNLSLDPKESVNLASVHPHIVDQLLQAMNGILNPDPENPSP